MRMRLRQLLVAGAAVLLAVTIAPQQAGAEETRTVQVGNGNLQNEVLPIVNWWMDTYQGNEVIYYANELGLKPGDRITALSYHCVGGSAYGGSFNVRIKNTNANQFASNPDYYEDPSVLLVSYNDPVNGYVQLDGYSSGDWITFPLSTPFVYQGGNIVVDIRNTVPGQYVGWCYFAGFDDDTHAHRGIAWRNADDEQISGFHRGRGSSDLGFYASGSGVPNTVFTYIPAGEQPEEPSTITAPELSVGRADVGRVMQLPLTLHMPEGGNFTQIQFEVTFPEGMRPILDEDGCYGFAGDDITMKNRVPVVSFTDNMDEEDNWPTYMIVGANVTQTPNTANPCHVYTLNVTVDPGFEPGEREFTVYVKYVDSNNRSHTIGTEDDHATLTTVKFVDSDLLLGDANLDGVVDVDDMNITINIILGKNTLKINQIYMPRVDMNQNGNVDIDDLNAIINLMLGKGTNWHDDITTYKVNGVEFKMVKVEGGTFTMGATPEQGSDADSDEYPAHQVTLSTYSIGETEVTQPFGWL